VYLIATVLILAVPFLGSYLGFAGAVALVGAAIAQHLLAWWVRRKEGALTRTFVGLTILDLSGGAFVVFPIVNPPDFAEGPDPRTLVWLLTGFAGAVLALQLWYRKPIGFLPVRGEWARRLVAPVAMLLLQAFAPSTLGIIVLFRNLAVAPTQGNLIALGIGWIWLGTLPLYYTPLYAYLMRGARQTPPVEPAGPTEPDRPASRRVLGARIWIVALFLVAFATATYYTFIRQNATDARPAGARER
jgi:hypothetical protein